MCIRFPFFCRFTTKLFLNYLNYLLFPYWVKYLIWYLKVTIQLCREKVELQQVQELQILLDCDISAEMKATSFGTHSRDLSQLMAASSFDTSSFCDLIKEIINSDVVSSVENSYVTYIIMFIGQQWICACLFA